MNNYNNKYSSEYRMDNSWVTRATDETLYEKFKGKKSQVQSEIDRLEPELKKREKKIDEAYDKLKSEPQTGFPTHITRMEDEIRNYKETLADLKRIIKVLESKRK